MRPETSSATRAFPWVKLLSKPASLNKVPLTGPLKDGPAYPRPITEKIPEKKSLA
jgi:hypothetical protein